MSCMNRKYAVHAVHLSARIQYATPEISTAHFDETIPPQPMTTPAAVPFFTRLRVSKTAFREKLQRKVFPLQDHLDVAAPFLDPVVALE
ncbi:MAG: hypothetical protein NT047_17220 [Deltaproteobacteria bacterium]|nr:hypothetical protein [Deltaproteobacteria bacterium]